MAFHMNGNEFLTKNVVVFVWLSSKDKNKTD